MVDSYCERIAVEMKKERSFTITVIAFTVFFLFADQNLLAPNMEDAAEDFGMDEEEKDRYLGGYIALGFFIIGGLASCILGYWTDTSNRATLFGYVVFIGSVLNSLTYWVRTFWELFACRVMTGVAVGGSIPLMFSMIGDLYAASERVLVSTVLLCASGAGVACGQILAAYIGVELGWRAPFLVISIPSMLCAAIMYFFVKEPIRGEADAASIRNTSTGVDVRRSPSVERGDAVKLSDPQGVAPAYDEKITWEKLEVLVKTPSFILSLAQGAPGCLPWGMMYTFMNDFFHHDRGLSVINATYLLTVFGIAGILGALFGGHVGQILFNRNPRYQIALMGGSTLVGMVPILYLINAQPLSDPSTYPVTVVMAALGGFIININGPNIKVLLCNVVVPETRGCAFAVFALTDDIGKGLGPFIVSLFIEAFHDRVKAFNVVTVVGWGICGILLLCLGFTYKKDMDRVELVVAQALHTSKGKEQACANSDDEDSVHTKNSLHALLVPEET